MKFTDARDSKRSLKIVEVTNHGCWGEATQTAYIVPGAILRHDREVEEADQREGSVGNVPHVENAILLKQGDRLILTRDLRPGRPATYDKGGQILTDAVIGCTIPEVFEDVRIGHPIWFDDGKIGGVVEKVEKTRALVRITQVGSRGEKLRGDKGINLPQSVLRLSAMTAKDLADLTFVAQQADIVELSFVNTPRDVELLQ